MNIAARLSAHLDDFNLHVLYKDGLITYDDFKRLHAERAKRIMNAVRAASGVPTEKQQEALSRLLAGRGASHD